MFIALKTDYLQLWVLYKSDLRISTSEKRVGYNQKKNTFKPEKQ